MHAGWRGISLGIIKKYIEKIGKDNGGFSNTFVLIGPSIQECCFLIKKDVINYFDSKFYSKMNNVHFQANLQDWALSQILNSNISKKNVYISKNCTFCNENKYESYRRDGKNAGRMYAIIGWKD